MAGILRGIRHSVVSVGDAIEDRLDDVQDYLAKRKRELKGLTLYQHSKAIMIVAFAMTILYIVGLVTPEMIKGEFQCRLDDSGRGTSCDVAAWTDDRRLVQIGLWNARIHGQDYAICDDWPASDNAICGSIKAARAFVFLAIICAVLTVILAIMRLNEKHDRMPFKSVVAFALSGFFGMIAYSVWQGSCHEQLIDMVKDNTLAMFPTSLNKGNIRFWTTLGYSYCLILWAWLFTIGFIAVKVLLPGLGNLEAKVNSRMNHGGNLRTSF